VMGASKRPPALQKKVPKESPSPAHPYIPIVYAMVGAAIVIFAFFVTKDAFRVSKSGQTVKITVQNKISPLQPLHFTIPCLYNSSQHHKVAGCTPERCGRAVIDDFLNKNDAMILRNMAQKVIQHCGGGGDGGPTILDLASGAISYQDRFINFYSILQEMQRENGDEYATIWTSHEYSLLLSTIRRVRNFIIQIFGLEKIHLTKPLFFSHIESNKEPKRMNDEYWHKHIDRVAYGSFDYTALIYLSDFGRDFDGGQFVFHNDYGNLHASDSEDELIIEPAIGRLNVFTSGDENVHHVERITAGQRFALTIAFTCNDQEAIPDYINSKTKDVLLG